MLSLRLADAAPAAATVVASVPGVASPRDIDLDVSARQLRVSTRDGRTAAIDLPFEVDPALTQAKFKKRKQELRVSVFQSAAGSGAAAEPLPAPPSSSASSSADSGSAAGSGAAAEPLPAPPSSSVSSSADSGSAKNVLPPAPPASASATGDASASAKDEDEGEGEPEVKPLPAPPASASASASAKDEDEGEPEVKPLPAPPASAKGDDEPEDKDEDEDEGEPEVKPLPAPPAKDQDQDQPQADQPQADQPQADQPQAGQQPGQTIDRTSRPGRHLAVSPSQHKADEAAPPDLAPAPRAAKHSLHTLLRADAGTPTALFEQSPTTATLLLQVRGVVAEGVESAFEELEVRLRLPLDSGGEPLELRIPLAHAVDPRRCQLRVASNNVFLGLGKAQAARWLPPPVLWASSSSSSDNLQGAVREPQRPEAAAWRRQVAAAMAGGGPLRLRAALLDLDRAELEVVGSLPSLEALRAVGAFARGNDRLQSLALRDCSLTGVQLDSQSRWEGDFDGQALLDLAEGVRGHPALARVALTRCNLVGMWHRAQLQPLAALADALGSCAALAELDVSSASIGDAGVALLLPLLASPLLRRVGLAENRVHRTGCRGLAAALGSSGAAGGALEALDLSGNPLCADAATSLLSREKIHDPAPLGVLLDALLGLEALRELRLARSGCGVAGAAAAARLAAEHPALALLDLEGCGAGGEWSRREAAGALALAEALPRAAALRELRLARNNLGGEGMLALAAALAPPLRRVDLSQNDVDDEAAEALAARGGPLPPELLLGDNSLTDAGFVVLAGALAAAGVEELRVDGNEASAEGAQFLAAAAAAAPAMRQLAVGPTGALLPAHPPRELRLRNLELRELDAVALGELLGDAVEVLDLSYNDLGVDGTLALARGVLRAPALTDLSLYAAGVSASGVEALVGAQSPLVRLNLSHNYLGPNGWGLPALQDNARLESLDLYFNDLRVGGMAAVGQALAINCTLRQLNVRWNHAGDAGVAALAAGLALNRGLEELDVSGNSVGCGGSGEGVAESKGGEQDQPELELDEGDFAGTSGVDALCDALSGGCVLQVLRVGGPRQTITERDVRAFAAAAAGTSLRVLDVKGCRLGKSAAVEEMRGVVEEVLA